MKRGFKTLKFKITLVVVVGLTTGFFFFASLILSHQERIYIDYLKLNINSVAETILKALEIDMMQNNREAIDGMLNMIGRHNLIKDLKIFSHKEGKIYSSIDKKEKNIRLSLKTSVKCMVCHSLKKNSDLKILEKRKYLVFYMEQNSESDTLKAIVPVLNSPKCYTASCHAHSKDQEILGFLDIAICTRSLKESLNKDKWIIFLISAFFVIVLSSLIVYFLEKKVTYPIRQLMISTREISVGNFDVVLPVDKEDEIGELARSFKKMVVRIQEFKEKLEGLNRELEKRVEEKAAKLKIAQKTIIQAEKMSSLGRLAAVIAHEINNPISGLVVFINLLRKQVEKGNLSEKDLEKMNKNLAIMESEAKRCGTIVSELLAFSRSESQILPTDISEILRRSIEIMKLRIRDREDIVIKVDIEPSLPLIKCDAGKMQQVFMNLIQNAIEAMPVGGEISIKAFHNKEENKVEIEISDTGVGIPEEYLPHIFEPFYSSKENGQSIGIGLFVVYGVIEQIGGRITVDSKVGKGTTFKISLPAE